MGANNEIEIRNNFNKALANIQQLNSYLDNFDEEIQFMEDKALLFRLYKYILKYQKFEGIKRFSIPVIGCANCGKSTILNSLIGFSLLPSKRKECTKKGILIRYWNQDYIIIRKTKFVKEKLFTNNDIYYFESGEKIIAQNEQDIHKILEGAKSL